MKHFYFMEKKNFIAEIKKQYNFEKALYKELDLQGVKNLIICDKNLKRLYNLCNNYHYISEFIEIYQYFNSVDFSLQLMENTPVFIGKKGQMLHFTISDRLRLYTLAIDKGCSVVSIAWRVYNSYLHGKSVADSLEALENPVEKIRQSRNIKKIGMDYSEKYLKSQYVQLKELQHIKTSDIKKYFNTIDSLDVIEETQGEIIDNRKDLLHRVQNYINDIGLSVDDFIARLISNKCHDLFNSEKRKDYNVLKEYVVNHRDYFIAVEKYNALVFNV